MTIENSETVDGVGISKRDGKVVMQIADHLDWVELPKHMKVLAAKIEAYMAFAGSGELERAVPEARGRSRRIELVFEHQPSHEAVNHLISVKKQLDSLDVEFTYGGLPSGY
jgi:hypothetical protein